MLSDAGLYPIQNTDGKKFTEDDLIVSLEGVIGIITGAAEPITRKVIKDAKSLKVISRYGTGLDNIDLEAAEEFDVAVCRTPDAPTQAVAELTLALILNLSRKINAMDRVVRSGKWAPNIGNLLSGKTVGIVGLGRIGKTVVKLVEPFNLRIIVHEPYPDEKFVSQYRVKLTTLEQLLTESDIVSLHLPLTNETRGIIGRDEFSKMKKNALFINTARGGLVDEQALIEALEKRVIAGAALDVFETEPYDGELKEFENVLLTPHIGTFTIETRKKMEIQTVENLINALEEKKII
jgi:D-3-phosphoglycerate dehydrogenase